MNEEMPTITTQLPDLVNNYISIRAQRLAKEKEAESLGEQEDDLKVLIIAKMKDQGLKVLGAANGTVKLSVTKEPVATDWQTLYAYIKENDAFELLHKRITVLAVKERWEAGIQVPGVGETEVSKITVSKPA